MWKLDGTLAALDSADIVARLDLAQPQAGIKISFFDVGQESASGSGNVSGASQSRRPTLLDGDFLRVHFPDSREREEVVDCWQRGDDAVAVYATTSRRPARPEVYWRRLPMQSPRVAGIELIVSVQTGLLDAAASVGISTQLQTAEVLWINSLDDPGRSARILPGVELPKVDRHTGTSIFVFRPVVTNARGGEFSYAQMVFPSDFCTASIGWLDSNSSPAHGTAVLHSELFPESLEKGVIRRARIRGLFIPRANDLVAAKELYDEFITSPLPLTT